MCECRRASGATPSGHGTGAFPRPSRAENSGLCATPIPNRTFATAYVSRPFLSHARSDLACLATTYPSIQAFRKSVEEFHAYVRCNAHTIPNYAERHRYGERVSTAFVESTVNTVVGKRFSKRQQMRWSKPGAHLMLQTRTRVLDGTLKAKFQSWYPGLFNVQNAEHTEHDLDA